MRTAGLLAGLCALSLVSDARADSFELLSYTPPPGWSTQQDGTGKMFQHKDASGAGMLVLFAGRPGGGPPAEAFAEEWRTRVQPVMPTAAPEPVSQQVGDMVVAMSRSQVPVEGQTATIVFITMVGRGRVQSVLGVARGDAITAQVAAFFDGVKIAPGPAASAPDANAALELDVEAPPGYLSRREAGGLVIVPARADPNLPCNYGVTPSRPSLGSQEADAQAAFADIFAGWRKSRSEDQSYLKKGFAPTGWPFYGYRADIQRGGPQLEHAIGMVMVVPAGPKRVSILWGVGDLARCTFEDKTFALLFHSLRPRGWTADGGKALTRDLVGSWIYSSLGGPSVTSLYQFDAKGGFAYAANATTSRIEVSDTAALETTAKLGQHGRYKLRGNELELQRDGKPAERYRVRIVDEFSLGKWRRALYLLDASHNEVQYYRQGP